jgi:glycosyltransferase involved in cell wall biosynthesis
MREPSRESATCRVWILNHYAGPPDRPGGTRHHSLGRALVRRGIEVTIFAASFGHATGREHKIRRRGLVLSESFDGVRFVWVRTFPYHGNTWRRMVNMVSYAIMVVLAQFGRPAPDVVIGSTVHPFAALAGWLIAKLRGARFQYEIRDLWPQTLVDLGALSPGSPLARVLWAIEAFLVRHAEIVIALLPGIPAYLEGRGLPCAHVHYLPNGADLAVADAPAAAWEPGRGEDPLEPILADLARRRAAGEVVFAYAGAHGRVNRLDTVLHAIDIANRQGGPPVRLLLVGDGPEKAALRSLAAELQLPNVEFVDPVPKDRMPELLGAIDVGVVHATETPVYRYGISFNKVFDYMAARKPIAFACKTFNDPVATSGAGMSVAPDDAEALAGAFVSLATASSDERRRMGDAGRAFVEREHDFATIGAKLAELIAGAPNAVTR